MPYSDLPVAAQQHPYAPDVLGDGFEQLTLVPADAHDYEGPVVSTLVRKRAPAPATRAVLYVHGFNDYFFQRELAAEYNAHGFHFYALDLRKYGRSIRPHQRPNNVRSLTEYFQDLDAALAQVRAEGSTTLVLSGHSTGGLITALYAGQRQEQAGLAALVLNSPFLEMNQPWLLRRVGTSLLARLGTWWPDVALPGTLPPVYGESLHKQYRGEWDYNLQWKPNQVFSLNMGWLHAIRVGHARVRRGLGIAVPVLVLHSTHSYRRGQREDLHHTDAVLNVEHIRALSPRLGARVTVRALAGAMHDVFLSEAAVRAEAYRVLFAWLAQTLPPEAAPR